MEADYPEWGWRFVRLYFETSMRNAPASWGLMLEEIMILNGSAEIFIANNTNPCTLDYLTHPAISRIPHVPMTGYTIYTLIIDDIISNIYHANREIYRMGPFCVYIQPDNWIGNIIMLILQLLIPQYCCSGTSSQAQNNFKSAIILS